jgi:hypothetical protein
MAQRSKAELLDIVTRIVKLYEEDKLTLADIEK